MRRRWRSRRARSAPAAAHTLDRNSQAPRSDFDAERLKAIAADIAGDGDTALELLGINTYDIAVLDRDVRSAQAAVQLVLAQRSIGSQLVDNLNATVSRFKLPANGNGKGVAR